MSTIDRRKIPSAILLAGVAAALFAGCASQPNKGSVAGAAAFTMSRNYDKDALVYAGQQDTSDTGYKLYGIYDPGLNERIVLEAGYQKMGDTTFDGLYQGISDQGKIEIEAFEINVGYRYPFSEYFSAGGRIGAAYVDVQEREIFGGVPESNSASETVPYGGVVLRYAVNKNWGLAVHFDRYLDVGKVGATGEGDIDVFGISADFRFGGSNTDD